MMEIEGDKERTALAMAFARMWQDPQYKQEFLSNPKAALSREGVNFSGDTAVRVVEETPKIRYVDLEKVDSAETLRRLLPIPAGQEVRIVQSSADLRYLVLPAAPGWVAPGMTGRDGLLKSSTEVPPTIVSETSVIGVQETIQVEESIAEVVVVEVQTTELQVMDSQAIEVAQVEVESSVAEVVAMT